jgi:hypothetical protein
MKKLSIFLLCSLFLTQAGIVFAGSANVYPTGPKTVDVGQTFNVVINTNGAKEVDTIRINGSFTQDLLEYRGSKPTGVFQNISPGTYFDQKTGIFSFGAFTLSSRANGISPLVVLTFRALKPGNAYVQLTTGSKILSAGEEQIGTVGRLNITISEKVAPPSQPQPIPDVLQPGILAISLTSPTHPDPEKWYASRKVDAEWKIAGKPIKQVYIAFDESPEGATDQKETEATSTTFKAPSDGAWYVHLGVDLKDKTFERADLRVQIDTIPPHTIAPIVDQTLVKASIPNALRFATMDDTSGIDHYDVMIDGLVVTSTQAQAYPLVRQKPGKHLVKVTAFDRAGNNVSGDTEFEILPDQAPTPSKPPSFVWLWLILVSVIVILTALNLRQYLDLKKKRRIRKK